MKEIATVMIVWGRMVTGGCLVVVLVCSGILYWVYQ